MKRHHMVFTRSYLASCRTRPRTLVDSLIVSMRNAPDVFRAALPRVVYRVKAEDVCVLVSEAVRVKNFASMDLVLQMTTHLALLDAEWGAVIAIAALEKDVRTLKALKTYGVQVSFDDIDVDGIGISTIERIRKLWNACDAPIKRLGVPAIRICPCSHSRKRYLVP